MNAELRTRGARAIRAYERAVRARHQRPNASSDRWSNRIEAEKQLAEADALREPVGRLVRGAGEVVSSEHDAIEGDDPAHTTIVDTLEHPDTITTGAAEQRTQAALEVGVLRAAVDAAQSAK